jgi:hypothetical protein
MDQREGAGLPSPHRLTETEAGASREDVHTLERGAPSIQTTELRRAGVPLMVGKPALEEPAGRAGTRLQRLWRLVREIWYGMTGYEFAHHALHLRAELEDLLLLMVVGDIIGVPVLPPYYARRLLPYLLPRLEAYKRRALRERDPLENEEYDLIEM